MSGELSSLLQRFRVAAANFIEVVDSVSNLDSEIFLARVNLCLAELYSSALYLPPAEPETTLAALGSWVPSDV